jgi:hypothetical protein
MAIVTEISWNGMFAGKALPDSPVRTAFREAVEAVADKARTAVPDLNGRTEKAVQIVLNGDVSIAPDGQGRIASQSNGSVEYLVGKGEFCICKTNTKSSNGLCKHVLSYHIYTRARALAREKLEALEAEASKLEPVIPPVEAPIESELVTPSVELPTQLEQAVAPMTAYRGASVSKCVYRNCWEKGSVNPKRHV